jgi:WD40 repeat protein
MLLAGGGLMADAAMNRLRLCSLLAGMLVVAALLEQPASGQAPPVRLDVFGDPLPEEAISRLGTVRFRHGLGVEFLRFTPDGKLLVSQGGDGVRTWDVTTGKQLQALLKEKLGDSWDRGLWSSPLDGCGRQPLSDDGNLLATVSVDGIQVWNVKTGRQVGTVGGSDYLRASISPDGKRFAAVLGPGSGVEMWERGGGRLWSVSAREQFVQFAPDGKTLIVVGSGSDKRPRESDNSIRSLDPATGRQRQRISLGSDWPGALVFSPDGRRLAALCGEETGKGQVHIRIWETDSGKELLRLDPPAARNPPPEGFLALAFTPDGKSLLTSDSGDDLVLWDVATGKKSERIGKGMTGASALAIAPDGKTVAVGFVGASIRVIDRTTGADRAPAPGIGPSASQAAFTPDGGSVVTIGAEQIVLWDAANGRERRRLVIPISYSEGFLADGGVTAFLHKPLGKTLRCWDLLTGKERSWLPPAFPAGQEVVGVVPGGKMVAVGPLELDSFSLLDAATGRRLQNFAEPDHKVANVGFTMDGRTLVAFYSDGTARVWDVASGARGRLLVSPGRGESEVVVRFRIRGVVSPDGSWVAADHSGELTLFDVATGQAIHRLDHLRSGTAVLAVSANGRVLAWSGSEDPVIHLMEAASGKERRTLTGHRGPVHALAFSADSTKLVSCSSDTTAVVWDLTGRLASRGSSQALSAADLSACWSALAGDDASRAYQAMGKLTASPGDALPYLREHLRPVRPVTAKRLANLITELDSDHFQVREDAARELQQLGELASSACRTALAARPSPELRRRLQPLVERQSQERLIPSAANLRAVRAVEVLEAIGTAEARRHLEELAAGAPEARLTREARAALDRLMRGAAAP